MTRTRRFLGGLTVGYANQALVTLVGLWLTAFLLARLGQSDYGLWLVGTQVLGYLLLLDLGVVALLPREAAFATGRSGGAAEAADLPEIVGRTARLVFWQMPLVALVAAIVWFALPQDWEPLRGPLGIVVIVFVIGFPMRMFQALLNGLQDLAYLGLVYTGTWIVGTAVTVLLVVEGLGLYALAIGWALAQLLSQALWLGRVKRRYPHVFPLQLSRIARDVLKDRLARSGWNSLSQISQVLLQGTDILIIGKILGPEATVPYFCTAKVLTVLSHQPQILAHTAQPALSELRAGPDRHRLVDVCGALTRAILVLSGAIVCVVLLVNEGFVAWWVGPEQYGGFLLTAVLLAAMLLRHWNVTAIYSLFSFGRDRRISLTTLVDGLVTVSLSVLLVLRFGLVGAALGSVLGVVLVGLPANLTGLASEMKTSVASLLLSLWPWLWRFALLGTLAVAVQQVWSPRGFASLVATTLTAGAVYAALMYPLVLEDPLGMYVRPRLEALRRVLLRRTAGGPVDG